MDLEISYKLEINSFGSGFTNTFMLGDVSSAYTELGFISSLTTMDFPLTQITHIGNILGQLRYRDANGLMVPLATETINNAIGSFKSRVVNYLIAWDSKTLNDLVETGERMEICMEMISENEHAPSISIDLNLTATDTVTQKQLIVFVGSINSVITPMTIVATDSPAGRHKVLTNNLLPLRENDLITCEELIAMVTRLMFDSADELGSLQI